MTLTLRNTHQRVRTHGLLGVFVMLCLFLTSCGSRKSQVGLKYNEDEAGQVIEVKPHGKPMSDSPVARRLVAEAREWLGTPYKYGGETKSGADCSGFVMKVYHKVTGLKLPRNSAAQCDYCNKIKKEELETGDLVFFSSNASKGRVAHVGMYVGDGIMIHASSSRGVIETDINSDYFVRHYVASGRVPSEGKDLIQPREKLKSQPQQPKLDPLIILEEETKLIEEPGVSVEQPAVKPPEETPDEIVRRAFGN